MKSRTTPSQLRRNIEAFLRRNGPTFPETILNEIDCTGERAVEVGAMLETMCLQGQVHLDLFSMRYSLFSKNPPKDRSTKDGVLLALECARKKCCGYVGDRCDCKFGVTEDTFGIGERGTGCPELRQAIYLVECLTDEEVESKLSR